MKKIYIYTNTFPPEFGAAPARLEAMAKGLQKAGYEVEVFTSIPNYPKGEIDVRYKGKGGGTEKWKDILVHRHWLWASHSDSWVSRFLNIFSLTFSMLFSLPKVIKKPPDAVLVQYPPVGLPLVAVLLAKLTNAKLILNCSDLWSFAISDLGLSKRKSMFISFLHKYEAWLFSCANWILAQSEEIKNHVEIKSQKPVFLYRAGVDCELFQPKDSPSRKGKLKIVYAGILGMAHGLANLCEQVTFSNQVELHIYGDGFERKRIEKWVKHNPDSGVFLHDSVGNEAIPEILLQYDAMLVSQKKVIYGTLPSKTYEAMAAGLPILFHGGGEGAELVLKYGLGLVSEPSDWVGLRENIGKMSQMDSLVLWKMGQKGRGVAQSEVNRNVIIEQFIAELPHHLG